MTRRTLFVFSCALSACLLGLPGCASKPRQPVTATSEDGPKLSRAMAAKLVKGTPEAQVKEIVGADPQETKQEEDGRTLWVYAWARVTADEKGNVLSTQIKTLSVWLEDGVVDETKFVE